jgi:branched-chain amino acid transport system permease protein
VRRLTAARSELRARVRLGGDAAEMRFVFKTGYAQDLALFRDAGERRWYALLLAALLLAPWALSPYFVSQLTFILIYSIVALGVMLLAGYTGLLSLGHAAFLAVGAYTEAVLAAKGWPFPASILVAALLAAVVGVIVGLPALRVKGVYLAIATIAFNIIVEEVLARWESVTGGNSGLTVGPLSMFGWKANDEREMYYVALVITVLVTLAMVNILRSPTGRAFVAIRDSEISAASMGIHLARYKTTSFALSAAITGIAGALYAHQLRILTPDQFTILQSIEMTMMVVIGGLGSIHGAFFGGIFLIALPQLINFAKDWLPPAIGQATGLQPALFGLVLIAFILFEPLGLYGRWVKLRTYFQLFPFYRKGMFRRQRAFQKSERLR